MPLATLTLPASPPTGAPGLAVPEAPALRGRRVRALAVDLGTMALASLLASAVAVAWLLLRTGAATTDPSAGDSAIAFALALSALPAWYALAALDVLEAGATPGQRRAGLRIEGAPARRLVRLSLAPVALPGWAWLSTVALLTAVYPLALLVASVTAIVAVAALASTALVAAGRRGLHDRLAGTRVVRV